MKSNYLILACAYPSAGHLMTLINVSMWLAKAKNKVRLKNKIELRLLPNPKNLKFTRILDSLIKDLISYFPSRINKLFVNLIKKNNYK